MELDDDLKAARVSITETAELAGMHPAHFRRLTRRGVFPAPRRTAKGRPYFDYELLQVIVRVLESGVGQNGEEVMFYRRRARKHPGRRTARVSVAGVKPDPYLKDLAEGLRQVGIPKKDLNPGRLSLALASAFGTKRPNLRIAIPAVARQLLG